MTMDNLGIQLSPLEGILLLGKPAIGKGTQALELVNSNPELFYILGTGDWFRSSEVIDVSLKGGKEIKEILESGHVAKGNYVPDELTVGYAYEKLRSGFNTVQDHNPDKICNPFDKLYLLDGFPRTVPQAKLSERINVGLVFYFETSQDSVVNRFEKRRKENTGAGLNRPDDTPEIFLKRLDVYDEKTKPLVDFYSNKLGSNFISVDASPDANTVHAVIAKIIGDHYKIDVQ